MADTLAPAPPSDAHNPPAPRTLQPAPLPQPATTPAQGGLFVALFLILAALILAGGAGWVLRRRRRPHPPEEEAPELPPRREVPEVPAALGEAQRRADEARLKAEEEAKKRAELEVLERAGLEAQRRAAEQAVKEAEEERKKAEYRARKAAEAEEKEQRRLLAEARTRQDAEEARRRAEEEAARKAAEEEAQRRRVAAVAGKTLAEGLDKTRSGFMGKLSRFWGAERPIDDKILAELEDVLFTADIGVHTAQELLEMAREKVKRKDISDGDKLKAALKNEVERILSLGGAGAAALRARPTVIMVVGVNGSGKTTTIGKLAAQWVAQGKKVVLGAGDTFRAAATEQLEVWAQRAGVPIVKAHEGADPGAVVFDAVKKGQAELADAVICDTAGRLHTKQPLMEELKKVKRVLEKAQPGAPHEVLLVLDATTGQNAIAQARQFHESLGVTGIALTKLDGTAKGGVIIGICDELKLPVRYVGVGEGIGDLKPFAPHEFVAALFQ